METTPHLAAPRGPAHGGPTGLGSRLPWALLFAATLALSVWSWLRVEGALFADVVEYLERALVFVRGEELLDAQAIRAGGITALHVPFLWLLDRTGMADGLWTLRIAAVLHVLVTFGFVVAVVRLGRGLAIGAGSGREESRTAGWLAGALALASPTLIAFAPIPMADIAAAGAMAWALERAFLSPWAPSSAVRRGAVSGLAVGLALICAYKVLPLVGLVVLCAPVGHAIQRGLGVGLRFGAGLLVGLGLWILAQCAFDALTYGGFGVGLGTYFALNFGPNLGALLYQIGLLELGARVYDLGVTTIAESDLGGVSRNPDDIRGLRPKTWYLTEFSEMLAPLALLPAALGGLLILRPGPAEAEAEAADGEGEGEGEGAAPGGRIRAALGSRLLALGPLALALVYAAATSMKGAKEMRIWLPILPVIAAHGGLGLARLAGPVGHRLERARTLAAVGIVCLAGIAGLTKLGASPSRPFGAYARATAWLSEAELPPTSAGVTRVCASSYHWGSLFRLPSDWTLEKLPHQLDGLGVPWPEPGSISPEERARTLEQLTAADAVLLHSSLLTAPWSRDLIDALGTWHVAAAFWERQVDTGIGAVLVLIPKAPPGVRARRLGGTAPAPGSPSTSGLRFERHLGPTVEAFGLSDLRGTVLPGDGLVWLEFELDQLGEKVLGGYELAIRVTGPDGHDGFTQFRRLGWGKTDVRQVAQGSRISESILLAPWQGAFGGGPQGVVPPGQPAGIWLDLATYAADERGQRAVTGRLEALDPAGGHAERDDAGPRTRLSDDGWRFSASLGELLVGSVPGPAEGTTLRLEAPLSDQ